MRREREREREEEPRRARLKSSSPTASHPKTDHPRPRSSSPIASPFRKIDRPRTRSLSLIAISPIVEPNRDHSTNRLRRSRLSSNPVAIAAPIGFGDLTCRRTQSRPDYEFFFLGVICVSGLRNEIIIFVWQQRKSKKM